MVDVSIVMPVYNTGRYLFLALTSALNQSFSNYEVICINDGSRDSQTIEIIEQFQSEFSYLHVINNDTHEGAAKSRNKGLLAAKGEYVIFLDSDDIFDEKLVEILFSTAQNEKLDVCMCGTSRYCNGVIEHVYSNELIEKGVFSSEDFAEDFFMLCGLQPWNKLIRRKMLLDNYITFQDLSSCNDVYFCCKVLSCALRIRCVNEKGVVIWRKNREGSISSRRDPVNIIRASNELHESLGDNFVDTTKKILSVLLKCGVGELNLCVDRKKQTHFCEIMKEYLLNNEWIKDNVTYEQEAIMRCFVELDPSDRWWESSRIFQSEIETRKDELMELLSGAKKIVLWGCGGRGKAFLAFCSNYNIKPFGLYDRDANKAREVSEAYEIPIVGEEEIFCNSDLVVAGNSSVSLYITGKRRDISIIDLQLFCPWNELYFDRERIALDSDIISKYEMNGYKEL